MKARKILALVAAIGMTLGLMALPAAAHHEDADLGFYQGVAQVAQGDFVEVDGVSTCDDTGQGEPDTDNEDGLFLPEPIGPSNVTGTWRLSTDSVTSALHGDGALDACGYLKPEQVTTLGLGAACGISEGYDGIGQLHFDDVSYQLSNVGWAPTSAGGTLPVTGDWDEIGGPASGTFANIVQAQGGADCAGADGAKEFTVVGVAAFVTQ